MQAFCSKFVKLSFLFTISATQNFSDVRALRIMREHSKTCLTSTVTFMRLLLLKLLLLLLFAKLIGDNSIYFYFNFTVDIGWKQLKKVYPCTMVNKCAAINCRSGYAGEDKDPNITFHRFPVKDEKLLLQWLKCIARKDFKPSEHSRICWLHFKDEDFVNDSADQQNRRKRKIDSTKLVRRRLKEDAYPSIFKDLPVYCAIKSTPARSGVATSSSRHKNAAARLEEQCDSFLSADKIENFNDFLKKISEELERQEYLLHRTAMGVNLFHMSSQQPLSIIASIFINTDLEVTIYQNQQVLHRSTYQHIISSNKVTLISQVTNLMAYAKNEQKCETTKKEKFLFNITKLISDFLLFSENDQIIPFLQFAKEQFQLIFTNKNQRRYSSDLLMMSYIIFATSPRAYERLLDEHVVILPSIKTLRKITMNLDKRTGLDDQKYLQLRYSQLNAFDRNVILMIDEIYLSKRVEATGGQIFGLTENCQVAVTALCFMIKSLSSNYKDMVGIYPVKNLKAETQKQCFDKIIQLLHEVGFNVIGISVDNSAANRKFYKHFLCNGKWRSSIKNKFTGGEIFLVFDPTHIIKNVYNNFLTRRVFKLPATLSFMPKTVTACFSDVEAVYNIECHKPLRIAYKLSETVLNPKSIEKVNVKLALSLLHESTITALKQYGYAETASVLELFLKLWSILNVSSPTIGKHKRDIVRDPVKSPDDWKLDFLLEFGNYVTVWEESMVSFLTRFHPDIVFNFSTAT